MEGWKGCCAPHVCLRHPAAHPLSTPASTTALLLPSPPPRHLPSQPAPSCPSPLLQWLEDNTPYNAKESEGRQAERRARELRSWARNLAIILFQALLQLPSVLCLLWYNNAVRAGNIQFASENSWSQICRSKVATYFYIYSGSAVLSQGLGFLLSPLRYLHLAACINVAAVLCVLWALYIPQVRWLTLGASVARASAWPCSTVC